MYSAGKYSAGGPQVYVRARTRTGRQGDGFLKEAETPESLVGAQIAQPDHSATNAYLIEAIVRSNDRP